ncbi:hypothetical protein TREES_T100021531 [Tupaia chinensis]|uniref:Uncharacterized protein n=1 Tax=Tupaia chinensis TaxID=246437 RepID=L9KF64_TUPCH|nr:hypothetical protein TREES_T100021531 [Tupaia chinensis]
MKYFNCMSEEETEAERTKLLVKEVMNDNFDFLISKMRSLEEGECAALTTLLATAVIGLSCKVHSKTPMPQRKPQCSPEAWSLLSECQSSCFHIRAGTLPPAGPPKADWSRFSNASSHSILISLFLWKRVFYGNQVFSLLPTGY